MPTTYLTRYRSPLGIIKISSFDCKRISNLWFEEVEAKNINTINDVQCVECDLFYKAKDWLDKYFEGKQVDIFPHITMHGTDFQKKVWTEITKIPFGTTKTYGEIAKNIGCKSAQAVGNAIAKNNILIIIPCHRVIRKDSLGQYSAGSKKKHLLLSLESNKCFMWNKQDFTLI